MAGYEIGTVVYCTNGAAGKLLKVVIDPHTKRVTDLVIEQGLLLKKDCVVPVELVEDVKDDRITLSINSFEMAYLPEYRQAAFTNSDPDISGQLDYHPDQTTQWALRYGETLAGLKPVHSDTQERVHKDIAPDRPIIGRGTRVCNDDETIGTINHLLVDDESGEITHLIVRRGLLPFRAVIPMSMVKEVRDGTVYVSATRQQLYSLEKFIPRQDRDIRREIRDRLQAVTDFDLSQIKVSLSDGLVRLTGQVATRLDKQRAQEIAERVKGVLSVENQVETKE